MWTKMLIGAAVGLVIGAVVGYIGKCRSGTCPITGNPYSGAIIGAILGGLIALMIADRGAVPRGGAGEGGPVRVITSDNQFLMDVVGGPRPVVVDFFATWCMPCKMLAPTLEGLAKEYAGRVDFVKVDIDQLQDLAKAHKVEAVPTVVLIQGGEEVHRWVGVQPPEEYRRALDGIAPQTKPQKETPMTQPAASVTMKGNPVTLSGRSVNVGDAAPGFVAVDTDMKPVKLSDYRGKVVVLAAVPSLDTSVCSRETHRFNQEAAKLGGDVAILVVSMDLPFAQKRWCGAEGVSAVKTLSDHREAAFGRAYGVLMGDLRLLARAVFVVGRDGRVVYKELVKEVSSEPDYDAALRAVAAAEKG